MIKSFLYALGFFLVLLGTQCFFIDKFVFKFQNSELVDQAAQVYEKTPAEFRSSPTAAWCLIILDAAIVIYNFSAGGKK